MGNTTNLARMLALVAVATVLLPLAGCGLGGMSKAVTTSARGFDRGECLSRQFKGEEPCDQDAFAAGE